MIRKSLFGFIKNKDESPIEEMKESSRHMQKFDSRILASSHINFLFGAGVNGSSFPQLSGFVKTVRLLEEKLGRKILNFEEDIEILNDDDTTKVYECFIREFEQHHENIEWENDSILNIEKMFANINRLVLESENRTITTKQINIYTFNYDEIVETVLKKIGVLHNVVSPSNIDHHDKFFELLGFDYMKNRYMPTYLISKIHGDITNPILPGSSKYDETLKARRFEILFKMKSQLSRLNSILIVIGYSGRDNHVNRLIKDCVASGLTIYWFRYDSTEVIPDELRDNAFIVDQLDRENKFDLTIRCTGMLEEIWEESLDE